MSHDTTGVFCFEQLTENGTLVYKAFSSYEEAR